MKRMNENTENRKTEMDESNVIAFFEALATIFSAKEGVEIKLVGLRRKDDPEGRNIIEGRKA